MTGKAKNVFLGQADIFVFPTYYPPEGHPWVVVEAMAFGLPVITTDHGAISESVYDGINGFIVEKQNPRMIANRLLTLLNNREMRRDLGSASRKLYLERFTEKVMVRNLCSTFHSTCEYNRGITNSGADELHDN